jgi:hypothetical protein
MILSPTYDKIVLFSRGVYWRLVLNWLDLYYHTLYLQKNQKRGLYDSNYKHETKMSLLESPSTIRSDL